MNLGMLKVIFCQYCVEFVQICLMLPFLSEVVMNTTNFAKSASLLSKYYLFLYELINVDCFICLIFKSRALLPFLQAMTLSCISVIGSSEEDTGLSRALSQLAELEEKMEQLHNEQVACKRLSCLIFSVCSIHKGCLLSVGGRGLATI